MTGFALHRILILGKILQCRVFRLTRLDSIFRAFLHNIQYAEKTEGLCCEHIFLLVSYARSLVH